MHRSSSRRRQLIRRTIAYSLMTAAVVAGSIVLVFLMLGYRFNKQAGTFSQGGLVQFVTQPSGASVTVGVAHLANKTPSKITLNPGQYQVVMEKTGYEPWTKTVKVVPGTVLWLNSARLIPSDLTTEPVRTFDELASMAVRPGGRFIALLLNKTQPAIELEAMSGDKLNDKTITLPKTVYAAADKQTFSLGEWSQDDDYLFIKHRYDGQTEWIALRRDDPSESQRITAAGDAEPVRVWYDPSSSGRAFVLYSDKTLRRVQLGSGSVSDVLLKNVLSVSFMRDKALLFTQAVKHGTATGYMGLSTLEPRTIATYETKKPVLITGNDYLDHSYLTTTVGSKLTIDEVAALPTGDNSRPIQTTRLASFNLKNPATDLTNHSNNRFIVAQQAHGVTVYDLELESMTTVPIVGAEHHTATPPDWLDPYYFWSDADGTLRLYEFDGTNQHSLAKVAPGFKAAISPNNKFIYSIVKAKSGYQLQRTQLIID